jgi:hypothetical protein
MLLHIRRKCHTGFDVAEVSQRVIHACGILNSSSPVSHFAVMFSGPSCRHTFAGTESNHEKCSLSGDLHA